MNEPSEGDVAVEVRNLRRTYGATTAVSDISFRVRAGEVFGMLGPNGSGKTTTVECVQGLRRRDSGTVRVLGIDPQAHPAQARGFIGSQLQDSALPERLRVREALQLFARAGAGGKGRTHAQVDREVDDLIEAWGLAEKRSASFGSLSGGQRQRLLVALALVNRPTVVFLDEMTTGLDPQARREAWDLIARVRDTGSTVVLVSHFMDEAEALCDRLCVVSGGVLVASGTPAQLVADHAGEVRITLEPAEALGDHAESWLAALPGAQRVHPDGRTIAVEGSADLVRWVGHELVVRELHEVVMQVRQQSLEEAYLRLLEGTQ